MDPPWISHGSWTTVFSSWFSMKYGRWWTVPTANRIHLPIEQQASRCWQAPSRANLHPSRLQCDSKSFLNFLEALWKQEARHEFPLGNFPVAGIVSSISCSFLETFGNCSRWDPWMRHRHGHSCRAARLNTERKAATLQLLPDKWHAPCARQRKASSSTWLTRMIPRMIPQEWEVNDQCGHTISNDQCGQTISRLKNFAQNGPRSERRTPQDSWGEAHWHQCKTYTNELAMAKQSLAELLSFDSIGIRQLHWWMADVATRRWFTTRRRSELPSIPTWRLASPLLEAGY